MKFTKLIGLSFFLIMTQAYAIQCPFPSQLKHVPGQRWTLDPAYISAGWTIYSDPFANSSSWTSMPENHPLYVQLYPQNSNPITAWCAYGNIPEYGQGGVYVTHTGKFDPATIPVPPFVKDVTAGGTLSFRCDDVASRTESCRWG